MRIIGAANDFWRIRLSRIDTTGDLDFEWHDDILYRQPQVDPVPEIERWSVQAIRLDDVDSIIEIGSFEDRDEAQRFVARAEEDLNEMTKSQFEEIYLVCGEPSEDDAPTL